MLTIIFILGAIVGSFLNVVIYRYNSGTSPLKGRSQCFACGKTLSWYELVPLFSFLLQHGRCRGCSTKLSWQYPIVEAITGVMFVAVYLLGKPLLESTYLVIIFSILLVIAVYDMRHKIIPDGLVATFAVLSIGWFLWPFYNDIARVIHFPYYWTLIAGPMLFFPFWFLWFVSRGRWLGLGDGKLALGIGWFLGATLGGSAVMLGFWIGAAYALIIIALQKLGTHFFSSKLSMKSEIPFGPFLILGVFIVYFTGVNFFDGSVTFFNF